jgi:transcriptional regulator with XRE-family HTH domain
MNAKTVLKKARKALKKSGLTYQQVGERMGYPPESARQSVGQFLSGTNPSVKMLLRFAKAVGVDARDLL